jgi:hypothetical protein
LLIAGADPETIRINDANNPDPLDAFESALKRCGRNASEVIRHLADAYTRYVDQHKHGPPFPVQIVPFEPPTVVKRGIES